MQKIFGLLLMAALVLAIASCTQQVTTNGNANTTTTTASATPAAATPTTTPAASPSPGAPTGSPSPAPPTTANVENDGNKWKDTASNSPVTTIKVGGTITWKVTGGTHNIKRVAPSADNGCDELDASFDSGDLTADQTVTRTFTKAGTFGYRCGRHGGQPNCKTPPGGGAMPGIIKVVP